MQRNNFKQNIDITYKKQADNNSNNQKGVVVELNELISLKELAQRVFLSKKDRTINKLGHSVYLKRGLGMEFTDARIYVTGDDIKKCIGDSPQKQVFLM